MKKVIFFLSLVSLLSCSSREVKKEYYPNGSIKALTPIDNKGVPNGLFEEFYESGELKAKGEYVDGVIRDTVFSFHRNGKIESKGLLKNGFKISWWSYFNEAGRLKETYQYLNFNDSIYKNQTMVYREDGSLDLNRSSFYELKIPDTIELGKSKKNIGRLLKYNSNFKTADLSLVWVVIENQYSENSIKKDTFSDGTMTPKFGIFGYKPGIQKVNGFIIEDIIYEDSISLTIKKHKKYFEKQVYVKDTIK